MIYGENIELAEEGIDRSVENSDSPDPLALVR